MIKKRVLVLFHEDLLPPNEVDESDPSTDFAPWITEYNVLKALKNNSHEVLAVGVYRDLSIIRKAIEEFKPHVVFNLLEEFDGEVLFDQNVVSYLELMRMKYTGCNPRGLMIARDKALAKKLLSYHRISTPRFQVFGKNKPKRINKKISFPLIVKCLYQEASLGLANASVVNSPEKLYERIDYLRNKYDTMVIAEEFIEGREFYVGIMGHQRLVILPIWELKFENVQEPQKEFYSEKAKWDSKYRKKKGILSTKAQIDDELKKKIEKISKKTYRALELSGYARIDIRVDREGNPFVLEANPNPNIASNDEFALSACEAGIEYGELINRVVSLGLKS